MASNHVGSEHSNHRQQGRDGASICASRRDIFVRGIWSRSSYVVAWILQFEILLVHGHRSVCYSNAEK